MSTADAIDWTRVSADLEGNGYAVLGRVIGDEACDDLANYYDDDTLYRSRIHMQRHGFGKGEYKYFAYPLPEAVAAIRTDLYQPLATIANRWEAQLGSDRRFPGEHAELLEMCHADGQIRPTPLILKYHPGDYNCLHQDLYGAHVFPIQMVILLSDERTFEGGEFILTEQRPRMQSRAEVVRLRRGFAVAFAVNERPRLGTRGYYRVKQRHGVSRLRSGTRFALGVIFHDAM